MTEFGFEISLCAALETRQEGIIARQLGAGVDRSGRRIMDVVTIKPGPQFDRRTELTSDRIPDWLIEAPIGPGRFRPADKVLAGDPQRRKERIDWGVDLGLLEYRRKNGTRMIRQTARYPDQWFETIVGVENKPDLGRPGDLDVQTRFDVSLGLLDYVIVATETHVTRAHLNRIPDEVGVWEYSPGEEITVVQEPSRLAVTTHGIELVESRSDHMAIQPIDPDQKAIARRRLAERAYGKGWRTFSPPPCTQCTLVERHGTQSLPYCQAYDQIIHPATECGPDCPAYEPGDRPPTAFESERAQRTGWNRQLTEITRKQAGLDRFQ